jgi:hypothetical protein
MLARFRTTLTTQIEPKIAKLLQWFFFNIGIAFIPMIFAYTITCLTIKEGQPYPEILKSLPAKEILILSTAINGESISELFQSPVRHTFKYFLGGTCLITAIFTSSLFAVTPLLISDLQALNISLLIFIASFFLGITCKLLGN